MSPISRFSRPTQHIYQATYEPLPFQQLATVGMQMQQEYDREQDLRQSYLGQQASLASNVGGGDIEIANQMYKNIEDSVRNIRQQYPDYRSPESKAAFRDLIVSEQRNPKWQKFVDTKTKADAAQINFNNAPYAPDWSTAPYLNQQAAYNIGGSSALEQFNLETFGIASNDFINVQELAKTKKPTEYWENRLSKVKEQILKGGKKGVSRVELASLAGLAVTPGGGIYFSDKGGIPPEFLGTNEGIRFRLESKNRFDNFLANNPKAVALIVSGQESYEGNLRNQMLEDYKAMLAPIIEGFATEKLDPTAISKFEKAQQSQEDYLNNDFAQAVYNTPEYTFNADVIKEVLDLQPATQGSGVDGYYTYSGNVKVSPANIGPVTEDYNRIINLNDNINSFRDIYADLVGNIDEEEIGGLYADIEELNRKKEEDPNQAHTYGVKQQRKRERALNKLKELRTLSQSNTELPEYANRLSLDLILKASELMIEDYNRLNNERADLMSKYGQSDIDYYEGELSALNQIGQELTNIQANLPVTIVRGQPNKFNDPITRKPVFYVRAEASEDVMKTIIKNARERGADTPRRRAGKTLDIYTNLDSFLKKGVNAKGEEVYFLDTYIPTSDINQTRMLNAYRAMHGGRQLKEAEERSLVDGWNYATMTSLTNIAIGQ